MEDLLAVEGISESTARLIYNHFHEKLMAPSRLLNIATCRGDQLTRKPCI